MELIVFLGFVVLLAYGYHARNQVRDLQDQVRSLTRRVYDLEQGERVHPVPEAVKVPSVPDAPVIPLAPAPFHPAGPALTARLRDLFAREEWETIVGGSLLNKLGALVLVVGIVLFLSYSFTRVSAGGRIAMAFAVSGSMLVAGAVLERRSKYRIFSRGLTGGGWATLYATAYAMYAIPATRVIANPAIGAALLLGVAVAMVIQSIRYRSQAASGVAYFTAFAALAVTPSTPFAVLSLVPLAASLLALSVRFQWHSMALFGMLATYGTVISRGHSNATPESSQLLFVIYWALFEAFDLLRIRDRRTLRSSPYLFPLNAICFLALSYATWSAKAPERLWQAAALGSLLYLASALMRIRFRPPSSFSGESLTARAIEGSYEGALSISVLLAGLAIAGRVPGIWMSAGYALLAESLYLAGVRWRQPFVRALGGIGFAVSLGRLALFDAGSSRWTAPAVLHMALFYWNRAAAAGQRARGAFSYGACALGMAAIAGEMPTRAIGGAWILFGYLVWEIGLRRRALDLRYQGYAAMAAGFAFSSIVYAVGLDAHGWQGPAAAFALAVGIALRMAEQPPGPETRVSLWGVSAALSMTSSVLLLSLVPEPWVGLAWCLLAIPLFEVGRRGWLRPLTALSMAVAAAGWAAVVVTHMAGFEKFPLLPVSASYGGAALAAIFFTFRTAPGPRRTASAAALTAFAATTAWLVLADVRVALAWAVISLLLIAAARRWNIEDLHLQSAILALLVALPWTLNSQPTELLAGVPERWLTGACVIAAFYAVSLSTGLLHPRWPALFSLLATALLTWRIYGEVSGSLLTVAWGVEGLALLLAGFPLHERLLRLPGLALLLTCIGKLFVYDLRNLETIYRILSFVALGMILLGVSWMYARYRARIHHLL